MRTDPLRRPLVVAALALAVAGASTGCATTSDAPSSAEVSRTTPARTTDRPTTATPPASDEASALSQSYNQNAGADPTKASFCRSLDVDSLLLKTFGSVEFAGSAPPVSKPDAAVCTYRAFTPRHSFVIGLAVSRSSPGYGPSAVCGPGGSSTAATQITRSFELGDLACQQQAKTGFRSYTVAVDRGISASVSLVDGYGAKDRSFDRRTRSTMRHVVEVVLDQRSKLDAALPGGA